MVPNLRDIDEGLFNMRLQNSDERVQAVWEAYLLPMLLPPRAMQAVRKSNRKVEERKPDHQNPRLWWI